MLGVVCDVADRERQTVAGVQNANERKDRSLASCGKEMAQEIPT